MKKRPTQQKTPKKPPVIRFYKHLDTNLPKFLENTEYPDKKAAIFMDPIEFARHEGTVFVALFAYLAAIGSETGKKIKKLDLSLFLLQTPAT